MPAPVLVTFATSYGSTAEVAAAVAQTLEAEGLDVTLVPVRKVNRLTGYSAVVIGAPLYMFQLHRHARRFFIRHRKALSEKPVAVFSLGPFHEDVKEWQEAKEQLDKALDRFPWLNPVSIHMVGGKFDPAALRFPFSWLPALKKMEPVDIRDWKAVGDWAGGLVRYITGQDKG